MRLWQRAIIVIIGVAVFWPWIENPFAYVHWRDRFRTSVPIALIFGRPCTTYTPGLESIDDGPNCYRYGNKRVYQGIWLDAYEGSTFYEGQTTLPKTGVSSGWLTFSNEALAASKIRFHENARPSVVQMVFSGRRTLVRGSHGHMGMWPYDIMVDHVIAYRKIG